MFKKMIKYPFILWIGVLLLTVSLAQFLYGPFKYNENAVKIEPAHRTSRATASESKSHPKIGWLEPVI